MPARYVSRFEAGSTYERCVQMLDAPPRRSDAIVLDLGCGYGALAEGVAALGCGYVGTDIDDDALRDISARGHEVHAVDLGAANLADVLAGIVAGRPVAAIALLDAVEHVADTRRLLSQLSDAATRFGEPPLILSVPNIAHIDIATKLLATGHFDYTELGLLDQTHLQFFTEERLTRELALYGWTETARRDVDMPVTEQRAADHPALADGSPVFEFLSVVRAQADENAHVYQFVRRFDRSHREPELGGDATAAVHARPFLTVIVHSSEENCEALAELLHALAGQSVADFEVQLVVQRDDHDRGSAQSDPAGVLRQPFDTSVHYVTGGTRAAALNIGLEAARGQFIALLDETDRISSEWVATFQSIAHRPAVLRCRFDLTRENPSRDEENSQADAADQLGARSFDLVRQLYENNTPPCAVAIPQALVTEMHLRFDPRLAAHEDWDLLLRAVEIAGVSETDVVTSSPGPRFVPGTTSTSGSADEDALRAIFERLDRYPLLLAAGTTARLREIQQRLDELVNLSDARGRDLDRSYERLRSLEHELAMYRRLGIAQAINMPRRAYRRLRGRSP